ncbi:MAG: peptidylprolyl isomerase [Proteobacteria bacterium]|nr:peptidylprolyl isomerase [Pseudomonadota bacterium]
MRFASALVIVAVFVFAAPVAPVLGAENPVIATVNGAEIHLSDAQAAYQNLPQQYKQVPFEAIFPGLVDSLVDARLATADARAQKLQEDKAFKEQMVRIEGQLLQQMMLAKVIKEGVSDAAVKARYDAAAKELANEEQVKASHILLKTEADAKAVVAELNKGGDFAELAKKKSTGPSAPSGGDLGFFGKGQMVPEFEKVAFTMKNGEFTKTPVQTQFGWHVIRVEDRKKQDVPSFEKMAPSLRSELSQEAGIAYITKLRVGAKIARFNSDGSPQKDAEPTAGGKATK